MPPLSTISLLAPGNKQKALIIEVAKIAGVETAVASGFLQ
jgi:hypothetical protein